ncbi:hypothetical protein DFP72DRAFT_1179277 [Ephemerocybe angulata]|uniref:Uncharacterized protein n=1 Tax=Ephemerocybe angulata TaxID=980116 RepID=A0A8H6LV75_9AGAR|nr:hypothetical protein DFP72DRAFT_1179277 [Tulosesus angulatus]
MDFATAMQFITQFANSSKSGKFVLVSKDDDDPLWKISDIGPNGAPDLTALLESSLKDNGKAHVDDFCDSDSLASCSDDDLPDDEATNTDSENGTLADKATFTTVFARLKLGLDPSDTPVGSKTQTGPDSAVAPDIFPEIDLVDAVAKVEAAFPDTGSEQDPPQTPERPTFILGIDDEERNRANGSDMRRSKGKERMSRREARSTTDAMDVSDGMGVLADAMEVLDEMNEDMRDVGAIQNTDNGPIGTATSPNSAGHRDGPSVALGHRSATGGRQRGTRFTNRTISSDGSDSEASVVHASPPRRRRSSRAKRTRKVSSASSVSSGEDGDKEKSGTRRILRQRPAVEHRDSGDSDAPLRKKPKVSRVVINSDDSDSEEDLGPEQLAPHAHPTISLPPNSPRKRRFKATPDSPPSSVITTPVLDKYKLSFNVKYNVLICTLCRHGFAFNSVYKHVTGKNQAHEYVFVGGKYRIDKSNHKSAEASSMSAEKWKKAISDSLAEVLGCDAAPLKAEALDSKSNWRAEAVLLEDDLQGKTPVEGIEVLEHGYICTSLGCKTADFPWASPSLLAMGQHRTDHHPMEDCGGGKKGHPKARKAAIQTILGHRPRARYFEVTLANGGPSRTAHGQSVSEDSEEDSDVLDIIAREAAALLPPVEHTTVLGSSDRIEPAFHNMRMVEQWKKLELKQILNILSMTPLGIKDASRTGQRLRSAVAASFMAICKSAQSAHPNILSLITRGPPPIIEHQKRKPFTIPQQEATLRKYYEYEVNILMCLLEVLERPIYKRDTKEPVFAFDPRQEQHLRELSKLLRLGSQIPLAKVSECVGETLHTLYFPESPDDASFDCFADPVTTYFTIKCLTTNGSHIPLRNVPVALSPIQFSIRLRGYNHIYTLFKDSKTDIPISDWTQAAHAFYARYLADGTVTPYGTIRFFMHTSSVAQRNAMKLAFVAWFASGSLLVNQEVFELDKFKDFLDFRMSELECFIKDSVLFGFTLESLKIRCDLQSLVDTKNTDSQGYGPLLPQGASLANPDSNKFFKHLTRVKVSPLVKTKKKKTIWNSDMAYTWAVSIDVAAQQLCALCHILQGSPGRGTEEALMQASNTIDGRRHLFVDQVQGTIAVFSNWSKTTSTTGKFKEILRVYPYRLARLVFIMIRIVRPVLLHYLGTTMKKDELKTIRESYRTFIWSGTLKPPHPSYLGRVIPAFFASKARDGTSPFKWIDGLRLYRHIVVAIQRKHFPRMRYTEAMAAEGISVPDEQAGRSAATSASYYAVEEGVAPGDQGLLQHYTAFSAQWHIFLGQETSFNSSYLYPV